MPPEDARYARVSSIGQGLRVQKGKLEDCDKVDTEKCCGLDTVRPQLKACLDHIREGDTPVATRLDGLARSRSTAILPIRIRTVNVSPIGWCAAGQ